MFTLAHISDVHLGPLPDVAYRELVSKRVVGYVNWHRNRRALLHDDVVDAIIDDIRAERADHIAVTGDLVNLALDREVELAQVWLEELGAPDRVSVVPGNHDAYVPGAFVKACRSWGRWMTGDETKPPVDNQDFPYLRVRGQVAIIGVTSARATAPFMASGYFREPQAERLAKILDDTGRRGLFRVIMIHHPPIREAVPQHKRLYGIARFQNTVQRHGAELVLHGHSHLPTLYWIAGQGRSVPVLGVAATGQAAGTSKPPAQWNKIEIDGEPGKWSMQLSRRGLTVPDQPPSELSVVDLSRREKTAKLATP